MVIFRGINLEFFNEKNTSEKKASTLTLSWNIDKKNFIILDAAINRMERTRNFY